jgi:hypothetical protein
MPGNNAVGSLESRWLHFVLSIYKQAVMIFASFQSLGHKK